jgi:aspartate/methionine/tyrosine aminotransferase
LRPENEKLFSWVLGFGPKAEHNLSSSGLREPDLSAMGIETSFERFAAEKDEHARIFAEEVAALYKVEPENVVATSGASEAIFMVYSVLGDGRTATVPLPNYGPMFTVPRSLGMEVRNILSTVPTKAKTMFGLTDPNNPTGRSLDEEAVELLTTASRRRGSAVFINETYREFAYPDPPRTHFGRGDGVVVCSTMTKFYGLGRLRVGWIIAEKSTARRLAYAKWAVSGHDSEYSLWIATQVLRKRERFVKRALEIRSRNIKLVRRFIAETQGVSAELGAAPFCLVRYERGPGSVALSKALLRKTGVLVAPGDFFGAPRAFRLCFTSEEGALRSGLEELSGFLNGLSA